MKISILALAITAWAQTNPPLPAEGNVSLTLEEYTRLKELAARPTKKTNLPPAPFTVNSAVLNLRVNTLAAGETVTGSVALEGQVLAKGDFKVPLVAGMVVVDAKQQGKDLPVVQDRGVALAVLSGPSDFSIAMETAMPVSVEPGRASFQLPAPTAGLARLTLSIPGDQTLVSLYPGQITSRNSNGGRTIIEATLLPGVIAKINWATRLAAPVVETPKEVRFLSSLLTLLSVNESELAVAALAEVTVLQGMPFQFAVKIPAGYELSSVTGPTLAASDQQGGSVILRVSNPAARNHQFLISLVKSVSANKAEIPLMTFDGSQRETGEVLVEGDGAVEIAATELGGLRRMDLKETNGYLRTLTRGSAHAAFRYQKKPGEQPAVGLEWTRFPDATVLAAVAQKAEVTTLITTEGRSLTEVKLTLRNQSQPFLKVTLPADASIVSSEVAGEKVKPVLGADGSRVPLLRAGFRPTGPYTVSFVFLNSQAAFGKKGGGSLTLPKFDIPIGVVEWEVFLPQQFKVTDFGGDAILARLFGGAGEDAQLADPSADPDALSANASPFAPGAVGGTVSDPSGARVAGASIAVAYLATGQVYSAVADANGSWSIRGMPSGRARVTASASGFSATSLNFEHDASRGSRLDVVLQVGSVASTVEVTASAPVLSADMAVNGRVSRKPPPPAQPEARDAAASSNVLDLQRRVAGVLPVSVSVPRTGTSYRFLRPLVSGEETTVTFVYKSK